MNFKDPKVQKIMLVTIVVAIVSYVYFGTSFLPFNYPVRRAQIKSLEAEHSRLSAELEKARKMVGNLAALEAEYQRLHAQWEHAQELLPAEEEMPDLLRKVTTAGMKSGVEFALFEPQAVQPKEFYNAHPVSVTVRGGYHQVGIFLSRLANLPRIVSVTRLELIPPKEKKGSAKRAPDGKKRREFKDIKTVEVGFTLSAYTLMGGVSNETVEAETASVE